ncbi:MAG: nuclear transport factor 2 family protein [Halobacteriota archaeon]
MDAGKPTDGETDKQTDRGDTPRAIVETFFSRMSEGADARASIGELFCEDATITLPGATFTGPDAPRSFLSFLAPRYEWADKEFDRWIETDTDVVSIGTLYGEANDGTTFDSVRYVDVYEVDPDRGVITRLDIWNDLAVDGVVSVSEDRSDR